MLRLGATSTEEPTRTREIGTGYARPPEGHQRHRAPSSASNARCTPSRLIGAGGGVSFLSTAPAPIGLIYRARVLLINAGVVMQRSATPPVGTTDRRTGPGTETGLSDWCC